MNYAVLAKKSEADSSANKNVASSGSRIGKRDDGFEREANRAADEVIAGSGLKQSWYISNISIGAPLQRKCACGGTPGPTGECEACRKKRLESKANAAPYPAQTGAVALPIVNEVLRSSGRPLDAAARAFMEPRFGHDFSRVRIHTDAQAAESARAINASAYTVGRDVVFGMGRFAPHTNAGKRLLGHELVHVLQQGHPATRFQREPAGQENPIEVTPIGNSMLNRADIPYPGVIGRCHAMGVPCPAPHFHHGTVCRLVSCSRAATAKLPFAISPGVCIYQCLDGQICACVLLGTEMGAICALTFCDSAASAGTKTNYEGLADQAVAMAQEQFRRNASDAGGRVPHPPGSVQTKLSIGEPGDIYEREADAVAERVLHATNPAPSYRSSAARASTGPVVQRDPADKGGGSTPPTQPPAVQPVLPTGTQSDTIKAAKRVAAIRTQQALFLIRGIVPPGPSKALDPAVHARSKAQSLARVIFHWDNPNMEQIETVVSSMVSTLTSELDIRMAGAHDTECGLRAAYVRGLHVPVVLCPLFISQSAEEKARTLIHESAHLARIGSADLGETYCAKFDCQSSCGGFDSADSWAHFIHCLSGQSPDSPDTIVAHPPGAGSPTSPVTPGSHP